jgi:alginate O-acetyltransferase complex protein AlgI
MLFYGFWDWRFLSLLLFSTSMDYLIGLRVVKNKKLLSLSFLINFSTLGFFKYFNFFVNSVSDLLDQINVPYQVSTLNIILPIGISFYTFQSFSYVFDIANKKINPEKDFITFACFVTFFPQIIAGPIERANNIIPQLKVKRTLILDNVIKGCSLVLLGLAKKILISDYLAIYVNRGFDPGNSGTEFLNFNSLSTFLVILAFTFQIYLDFSSYTNIARGIGKILNIKLVKNFNYPYLAKDFHSFWSSWHMSLTSWFKDYLYIPLGGNRVSSLVTQRNVLIVFVVSGLWHGASYNFLIWGFLHGCFYIIENLKILKRFINHILWRFVSMLLIIFLWGIFRAEGPTHAYQMFLNISKFSSDGLNILNNEFLFVLILSLIFICLEKHITKYGYKVSTKMLESPVISGIIFTFLFSIIFIFQGEVNEFVYFQF